MEEEEFVAEDGEELELYKEEDLVRTRGNCRGEKNRLTQTRNAAGRIVAKCKMMATLLIPGWLKRRASVGMVLLMNIPSMERYCNRARVKPIRAPANMKKRRKLYNLSKWAAL
jgi:hypothetical protein